MIRGRFVTVRGRQRPFVDATFQFPAFNRSLEVPLLVDTGADRTILSPFDARRFESEVGIDLNTLPFGTPSTGIGGQTSTRIMDAVLTLDTFSQALTLPILEAPSTLFPIPSLLGRDILAYFALFMEDRTSRVLLLEPHEADALHL